MLGRFKGREGDQSRERLVSGRIPEEKVTKGWSPQEIPRGWSPTRPKGDLQKVELPGNQEVPESVTPRADSSTEMEKSNGKEGGNMVEISRPNCITVNGIRLEDWRGSRKQITQKVTKNVKNVTPGRKRKNETPVPPSGQIVKYLVQKKEQEQEEEGREAARKISNVEDIIKKHEDIAREEKDTVKKTQKGRKEENQFQELKKTTFGTNNKKVAVKEGIKMFQDLAKGEECIIGSGRCSRHNVRLVKTVKEKKVSVIDLSGRVKWQMREAIIYACPLKPSINNENSAKVMLPEPESGGTNGRAKKFKEQNDDQSQAQDKIIGVEEDLQLDQMNNTDVPSEGGNLIQ